MRPSAAQLRRRRPGLPGGATFRKSPRLLSKRSLRARRFCETLQAAKGGDVNSMELLSQMLNEGYGCQRDSTMVRSVT